MVHVNLIRAVSVTVAREMFINNYSPLTVMMRRLSGAEAMFIKYVVEQMLSVFTQVSKYQIKSMHKQVSRRCTTCLGNLSDFKYVLKFKNFTNHCWVDWKTKMPPPKTFYYLLPVFEKWWELLIWVRSLSFLPYISVVIKASFLKFYMCNRYKNNISKTFLVFFQI